MYNIRNTSGRNLAIMLERGGFILRPNTYLDMDKHCSRKWIAANFDLRKLIRTGHLQVVHDSYATLPNAPVKSVQRSVQVITIPQKTMSRVPVQVVDLASMPDVEVDENKNIHLPDKIEEKSKPMVESVVAEEKIELVLPIVEDPPPKEVLAEESLEPPVEKILAPPRPARREDDIFSGFDSSRTPKLKRRKR
jgi:hypothetical protein